MMPDGIACALWLSRFHVSNILGILKEKGLVEPEKILYHCIRCGRVIPPTHNYIYCGRCMDSWQRYSNMRCVEQKGHCYICGRPYKARAEKPTCIDCYASLLN